jgi:hypothetical protein
MALAVADDSEQRLHQIPEQDICAVSGWGGVPLRSMLLISNARTKKYRPDSGISFRTFPHGGGHHWGRYWATGIGVSGRHGFGDHYRDGLLAHGS